MEKEKLILTKKLTAYFFYALILIFLFSFNFQDSRTTGGWYQQWLPTGLGTLIDITFTDSLTGFAIADSTIIKTTNGGDNWFVNQNLHNIITLNNIQFVNKDSAILSETSSIYKTTNKGVNWTRIVFPGYPYNSMYAFCMYALNFDTIYLGGGDGFGHPQLYFTTNGGINWILKYQAPSGSEFDNVYFYNKNIGFCCTSSQTLKTTNGGENWFQVIAEGFTDIYFKDSLTGWKIRGDVKKTTNGGINWLLQNIPNTFTKQMLRISKYNNDTIWGVGGSAYYGGGYINVLGIVYKTTNGGSNWGYQQPDTSIKIYQYHCCSFINRNNGWVYCQDTGRGGVHTNIGGNDTTLFTNINNIIKIPPKNFELKQNYPNPYNNSSLIEYYINEPGWVKLKIFDISGREMVTLVNEEQNTGGYGIPVAIELSSGVYFYKLVYINKKGELQTDTKKMVVIK